MLLKNTAQAQKALDKLHDVVYPKALTDQCEVCEEDVQPIAYGYDDEAHDGVLAIYWCSEKHIWSCWWSSAILHGEFNDQTHD